MNHRKIWMTKTAAWGVVLGCVLVMALHPHSARAGGPQAKPGSHTVAMAVNGVPRSYIVHVPANYQPQTPVPVVVMLHGGGGTATAAMRETQWEAKADKEGFLAVFPNAMARDPARPGSFAGNPQLWNDGSNRFYADQNAPDDVGLIAALLDDLAARYNVDETRVFVTGFSNGASMSFRIAAQLSDRVAAVAPVAGALWFDPPQNKYPVSLYYITGTADPLNPIEGGVPKLASRGGGVAGSKPKPPVRDSILKWAGTLGCTASPSALPSLPGVRTETYSSCRGGAEVVYVAIEGAGHVWPGDKSMLPESMVGKTSRSLGATDVIWEFFQKHARPQPDKTATPQVTPAGADKPNR